MPYDQELADRVLGILGAEASLTQRRMFGGLAYMLQGNMACCVLQGDLIVRVPKEEYADALGQPHIREMDYSGRSMRGWVMVGSGATGDDASLTAWVRYGASTALALPPK